MTNDRKDPKAGGRIAPELYWNGLLPWYDASKRDLPWRRKVSPYRTWVSEIMLQQTQVETVVPYFERFMRRFPGVASLASAPPEEVLKLWAGLGYYRRARHLQDAARRIAKRGGRFPESYEEVLALPGIGRYSAGAILSIAFGKPYPVLDGNVIRVLSRLFALRADARARASRDALWKLAGRLLNPRRPGDWNQALMELGARVCLPGSKPLCDACPLSKLCLARRRGLAGSLPVLGGKKDAVRLNWTALRVERGPRILLWRRDGGERFLPGHWALPESRHLPGAKTGALLGRVAHSITHHRIALKVRRALAPPALPPQAAWVPRAKLKDYLVSSLWRKAAAL